MSQYTNPSQLLLRNEPALVADSILVVNFSQDGFLNELSKLNPKSNIVAYTSNFATAKWAKKNTNLDISLGAVLPESKFDLIIFYYPKAKPEALMLLDNIRASVKSDARLLIVGENKGGVRSAEKQLKSFCKFTNKIDSARHCSLFQFTHLIYNDHFDLQNYVKQFELNISGKMIQIASLPGVFNHGELDKGTELLLENITIPSQGHVLDFGCGAGVISAFMGVNNPKLTFTCLDVSALATEATNMTLNLNKLAGQCLLSDGMSEVNENFDLIVSNPPFHTGISTDYTITEDFILNSKKHMNRQSSLTLVANSFLKYQPILSKNFGEYSVLAKNNKFVVYHTLKS